MICGLNNVLATLFKKMTDHKEKLVLPYFSEKVPAGFPSPAQDYSEQHLDLNEYLVSHPDSTFLVRATGESMTGAGIFNNDLLIVDRAIQAKPGDIVVANYLNELLVKRLIKLDCKLFLKSEHKNYPLIEVKENDQLIVFGVVSFCIHKPS